MTSAKYIKTHPGMKPYHRCYACAFATSQSGRTLRGILRPCRVELVDYKRQIEVQTYQGQTLRGNYAIPVKADGSLDWYNARSRWDVCLADTPDEIIHDMETLFQAARDHINSRKADLDKALGRIDAEAAKFVNLTLPPLN